MLLLTCKAKRHKENQRDVLYKLKCSNSLEVSCPCLVHLPNLQVFAVNNIFKVQTFMPRKVGGQRKGQENLWGAIAPWPPVEPPLNESKI